MAVNLLYEVSSVRRGKSQYIFACQGSLGAGESGRVKGGWGVEAIVSVLNRKLHNICFLAYREGVNVSECVFMQKVLHPDRRCDIPLCFPIPWNQKATLLHYPKFPFHFKSEFSLLSSAQETNADSIYFGCRQSEVKYQRNISKRLQSIHQVVLFRQQTEVTLANLTGRNNHIVCEHKQFFFRSKHQRIFVYTGAAAVTATACGQVVHLVVSVKRISYVRFLSQFRKT